MRSTDWKFAFLSFFGALLLRFSTACISTPRQLCTLQHTVWIVDMPYTPPSIATSPIATTFVASPVGALPFLRNLVDVLPTVDARRDLRSRSSWHQRRRSTGPRGQRKMLKSYVERPSRTWMIYCSARMKKSAERRKNGGSVVPPQSDLCAFPNPYLESPYCTMLLPLQPR
jgi:hypothetical protein